VGCVGSRQWMLTVGAKWGKDFIEKQLEGFDYYGRLEVGKENGYEHWQIFIDNAGHDYAIYSHQLNDLFPADEAGKRVDSVYFEKFQKSYRGHSSTKLACFDYVDKSDGELISKGDWSVYINADRTDREIEKTKSKAVVNSEISDLITRATIGEETVHQVLADKDNFFKKQWRKYIIDEVNIYRRQRGLVPVDNLGFLPTVDLTNVLYDKKTGEILVPKNL